ncbi:sigma-54-dependent Fis family transcriptional regulator [Halomonas sp. HMF6819]|uniref:sigma-54-dependent Fis family transcriptional regulator n=1 Tax=Halomonas sp. HMF6819 TaxID=3373085 RepID=UPI00378FD6F0
MSDAMPITANSTSPLSSQQRQHIERVCRFGEGREMSQLDSQPLIRRSWSRCLNEYLIDPASPRPARVVTQQTLIEHRESVDELLHVARAGVDQLYAQVAKLGYVLLLTDDRGVTVEFRGDPAMDSTLRRAGLYLGSDWNERFAGTCAVGTCLHERQAVVCHRDAHFDASHIDLTCTAAPITDARGNVMAALDISSLHPSRHQGDQLFGLSLVTLYARMIEDAYFLQRYRDCLILRFDCDRPFVHVNGRGLIAIEESGQVIAANTLGRELIEHHRKRWPAWSNESSVQLTELFECEMPDILGINRANEDQLRAFRARATDVTYFIALLESRWPRIPKTSPSDRCSLPQPLAQLGGDDPSIHKVQKLAKRLCDETSVNVLICGETGTGKEIVARALHQSSQRSTAPFIAVNCAAIPESLIESELFGYAPGAFTGGRTKGLKGLIAQADGGTLFLDEIGDMPAGLQTRLLRVLAEREVMPLGASQPVPVNIRLVSATHRDIASLVESGAFREDLFYRLNGAQLTLPALRDRADRIDVIRRVYDELASERQQAHTPQLRADAMSALLAYTWPGNIRQLKNALAFAMATVEDDEITVNDLPEQCLDQRITRAARLASINHDEKEDHLVKLLKEHQWNISAVARTMGVSRPTVYRQMRRQGVVAPKWNDH